MRWFLAWALLSGCYTVQIRTSPNQATVTTRGGMNVTAVREVKVKPFGRETLTVTAVKHRPLEVPVYWRPFDWTRRNHEVEVRLVEEHGPAVEPKDDPKKKAKK